MMKTTMKTTFSYHDLIYENYVPFHSVEVPCLQFAR